ncbi:MAG: TetR/AcrR family transcriptional regulator [bacterium]|nr:TetR/AcrR family transcriptional regulator [bacterium]
MRKNNRDKILETARFLFPKYGFNGVSIRTIASKAKLTTGAIYFHFKNKSDIYKTICFEAMDILIKKFKSGVLNRQTPMQKLISTYDSYVEFYHEHKEYYNVLMEYKAAYDSGSESGDGIEKDEIAEKLIELIKIPSDAINMSIQEGFYREVDPVMLSILLAAITEGMLQYKKLGAFDAMGVSDADFRKFMADVIGRGVETRN